MKAAVYWKNKGIRIEELPKPLPKDNEVLVRIHIASVNALDYRSIRMGITRSGRAIGADIAGRTEAVGNGVKDFKPGDAVFGDVFKYAGGFAEYAAVPESVLAHIPPGVSFEQAAALPVAALTALQCLRDKGSLQPGQRLLVCGAGGGVGSFAVQLGKCLGAHVTAVCGPGNVSVVERLGADRVVDYTKDDLWSSAGEYDLIAAVNGNYSMRTYMGMLRPDGKLVVIGGALSQIFKAMLLGLLKRRGKRISLLSAKPNTQDMEYLAGLVCSGHVRPVIDKRYTLEQAADAVAYLEQGHAHGKVMILAGYDCVI